ncbi:NUDIX hydrolase [Nocardia arthritidis]|uniref:NUDIX domain-containing protein n=1 Tax=Nocardia arthritidis TaxID=228602 RepID=A0A6G9YQD7_9NOCA|nr:NUDIX domain-containing protein [Nocardia arthritidis]QIS15515.1 NUDIX domain-containing protein [Nocardia arthritidis]
MPYTSPVDVFLLLTRADLALLARRRNTGYADGMWNMPSGKLEDGEDVVAAVLREAAEEIGIVLSRNAVRMVTALHYRSPSGRGRVGFVFHAESWPGEPYNREPEKCSELGWFPLDDLPADTEPYTVAGIGLYRSGTHFGLAGWS